MRFSPTIFSTSFLVFPFGLLAKAAVASADSMPKDLDEYHHLSYRDEDKFSSEPFDIIKSHTHDGDLLFRDAHHGQGRLLQTAIWLQVGRDIDGEAEVDKFGDSVSSSADGKTVAIGAIGNDGNGLTSGHVRVYSFINENVGWVQVGEDIDGEARGDASGTSVSLSADGKTVAIGASTNDGNGENSGHVRVYTFENESDGWIQVGEDIDGEAAFDFSGLDLSLSSDGKTVAIGAIGNDGNGFSSGHTRVYSFENESDSWVQLGEDIDGEGADNDSGWSVSLSSNGRTVAIGARGNSGNGFLSGHVRIYSFDNGNSWVQLGEDIDGEASRDEFGYSVSLASDGRTVAVSAPFNDVNGDSSGQVRVYAFDNGNNGWVQLGQAIEGEASGDESGYSVSLSADGLTVAIGARGNDGNDNSSGHVRVYSFIDENEEWVQVGEDIDGEAASDFSGSSVSLSADGKMVVVGAPLADPGGHVRIFNLFSVPAPAACPSCPDGGQAQYHFNPTAATWEMHRLLAQQMGCDLASITSAAEQFFALEAMKPYIGFPYHAISNWQSSAAFLGARILDSDPVEGIYTFEWVDGSGSFEARRGFNTNTPDYTNFIPGDPNSGTLFYNEPFVAISLDDNFSSNIPRGSWIDFGNANSPALYKCCAPTTTTGCQVGAGKEYRVSPVEATWEEHRMLAEGMGCELASIKSAGEQAAAEAILESYIGFSYKDTDAWTNSFIYIGAVLVEDMSNIEEGNYSFEWIDGSGVFQINNGVSADAQYTNFLEGDPNGGSPVVGDEPYLAMSLDENDSVGIPRGLWVDFSARNSPALYQCCTVTTKPSCGIE